MVAGQNLLLDERNQKLTGHSWTVLKMIGIFNGVRPSCEQ